MGPRFKEMVSRVPPPFPILLFHHLILVLPPPPQHLSDPSVDRRTTTRGRSPPSMLALWSRALVGAWFPPSPLVLFLSPGARQVGPRCQKPPAPTRHEALFGTLTDGLTLSERNLLRGVVPPMFNWRAALRRLRLACLRNHRPRSQQAIYPLARPGPWPEHPTKLESPSTPTSMVHGRSLRS